MSGTGRDQYSQVASSVPFDPDNCEAITSDNVQDAIDELCVSSGQGIGNSYQFGREGVHNAGTWLIGAETMSNKRGLPFGLENGKLKRVTVSTKNTPASFTVEVYYHDGNLSGQTLITSVTTAGASDTEIFLKDVSVPKDHQIAVKISSVGGTKPQETGVFLEFKGTTI